MASPERDDLPAIQSGEPAGRADQRSHRRPAPRAGAAHAVAIVHEFGTIKGGGPAGSPGADRRGDEPCGRTFRRATATCRDRAGADARANYAFGGRTNRLTRPI